MKPGDILVAGRNFGAGSSTPAQLALMTLGISAIVAESFSRIFFRSCISSGLLVNPCAGILDFVNTGDRIERDAEKVVMLGSDPMGGTPEQFAQFIRSEYAKWGDIVKRAGAKID